YQPAKAAILCAMFYLADEVKDQNVAVNIVVPGHTRSTGFDEQNAYRRVGGGGAAMGQPSARRGPTALLPDHMVPLVKFLVQQDAESRGTGKWFRLVTLNIGAGHRKRGARA